MHLVRKILFYIFILIYLVLCPLLIFYSFGYINIPKQGLSQTGLIHISTRPAGARIYVENRLFKYPTPASLTGLLPGNYSIKIKLKRYRDWNGTAAVNAGKAVNLENILLVPVNVPAKDLLPQDSVQRMITVPNSDIFILKKGDNLNKYEVYDFKKEKILPVFSSSTVNDKLNLPVRSIFTVAGSEKLVLFGGTLWDKQFWLIDTQNLIKPIRDISKLFSQLPGSVIWPENNRDIIFAVYDGFAERLDTNIMSKYPHYLENIKGLGIADKWIYVLFHNNALMRMSFDKQSETTLLENKFIGKDLFEKSKFYQIKHLTENFIIFHGNKGDLLFSLPPYKLSNNSAIKDFSYDEQNKKMLIWSKDSIWVADLNNSIKQDRLSSDDRIEISKVFDDGKNIQQCFWVFKSNYILMLDNDTAFLLDLCVNNKREVQRLITSKPDSMIFYSEKNGSIYYVDEGGRLKKSEIVPLISGK